ncbi:hypothetical protein ACQQ2T_04965 [Paraclostridium tenue]
MYVKNNIGDYAKIFEENIDLINGIACDCREIRIYEDIGGRLIEMSKDYLVQMKGKMLNFRVYG